MQVPQVVKDDGWLEPYSDVIRYRQERFQHATNLIEESWGSLRRFAGLHEHWGLQVEEQFWVHREWLPSAQAVSFVGEFNDWDGQRYPLQKQESGMWEVRIPFTELKAGQKYKLRVTGMNGEVRDRLPATVQLVEQDSETYDFSAVVPDITSQYEWSSTRRPRLDCAPMIYEVHIGIAGEEGKVHSYRDFADRVLPHVIQTGYNALQVMAVAEHPYYGSFGYHVSSFFAPSSRFGSAHDLKYLIDQAHQAGIVVLMDVVHSHAVKNIAEGLNDLDGSGALYFHGDERGEHPDWDSKCFDYGREEVQRFLLSNLRYWMEEFRFDGFRFDGVTSMLYWNRGAASFDHYAKYFDQSVDNDAILYLQLATTLIKELNPQSLIIAEDMSGMPGLCRRISEGGVGFTHRLAMGIPDYWIKTLKEQRDEDWNLEALWHTLLNRREKEAHIAYAESHDQALVGDKTLAFQLMDQEMYWHMNRESLHPAIDRGLALHKLIRLLTFASGGEGYLTFIGNEYGHPEWLDFPREGNDWSYHYARRQFSLVENSELRYQDLLHFEKAMLALEQDYQFLREKAECVRLDNAGRVLAFTRGDLLFVFNFSVDQSYQGSEVYLPDSGQWQVILDSDQPYYSGHGRVDPTVIHHTVETPPRLLLYLPCRVAQVLKRMPE